MRTFTQLVILLVALCGMASAFAPTSFVGFGAPARLGLRASPRAGPRSSALCMSAERVAEVKEVMAELLEFRQRIVDDATSLAKKVKAKPRDLRKTLESHADLLKIDEAVQQLEAELAELGEPVKA